MKKVTLLALHLGYGGVERCIISLANALKDKYEVEIVSIYKIYNTPGFDIDEDVKVTYLLNTDLALRVSNYKSALLSLRIFSLLRMLFNDYIKKGKIFSLFKDAFLGLKLMLIDRKKVLKNYLKEDNSDVYISTRTMINSLVSRYGYKKSYKIAWEHNHHHGNMRYATKVIDSVKGFNAFVLVSKDLKKFYEKKVSAKTIYIPNTIDTIPNQVSKLNNKRLISVGRLSKEKGYMDLLKVFKLLSSYDSEYTLDIIGDGPEKDSLRDYIKMNKLSSKVKLHGFRRKDYINERLLESSLYIMSSFTESFGIVLLEAMSCGLPCIAFSSAEGAREIIKDGKNGYLIENRSKVVMAKKIENYFSDKKIIKSMGKEARNSVKLYTIDNQKNTWIDVIERRK